MNLHHDLGSRIGALELNAAAAALHDATLEATVIAAPQPQPRFTAFPMCRHIDDDSTLEAVIAGGLPTHGYPVCPGRIDDAALEASVLRAGPSPYSGIPGHPMCRHVEAQGAEAQGAEAQGAEDSVLESAGMKYEMAPNTVLPADPFCQHIDARGVDDGALEEICLDLAPMRTQRFSKTQCV
jgi:hypothetical protein